MEFLPLLTSKVMFLYGNETWATKEEDLAYLVILSHTTALFAETKLLKFEDIITATKLKFAFDFKTGNLPDDLKGMLQFSNDVQFYMTRCSVKKCLFVQSTSYGIKTLKYSVPVIWNQFSSFNDQINEIKNHMQLNKFLKKYFLSRYEIGNNIL